MSIKIDGQITVYIVHISAIHVLHSILAGWIEETIDE